MSVKGEGFQEAELFVDGKKVGDFTQGVLFPPVSLAPGKHVFRIAQGNQFVEATINVDVGEISVEYNSSKKEWLYNEKVVHAE
jgi:hypothetical protein